MNANSQHSVIIMGSDCGTRSWTNIMIIGLVHIAIRTTAPKSRQSFKTENEGKIAWKKTTSKYRIVLLFYFWCRTDQVILDYTRGKAKTFAHLYNHMAYIYKVGHVDIHFLNITL